MRRDCDTFDDVSALPVKATAEAIAARNVTALLDYDGLHEFNNQVTLALRPSHVQVRAVFTYTPMVRRWLRNQHSRAAMYGRCWVQIAFLGFAGPVGGGATSPYSHSVVDPVIAPVESASRTFSEKLVYVKGSYQPQVSDTMCP